MAKPSSRCCKMMASPLAKYRHGGGKIDTEEGKIRQKIDEKWEKTRKFRKKCKKKAKNYENAENGRCYGGKVR